MSVYSPDGAFSGRVICVSIELFCPMVICSVFPAMFWFVFVYTALWLMDVLTCRDVELVSVVMNVSFPPGTTVLINGVVVMSICFGVGVNSFIPIIVAMIRITIIPASIAIVFVFIVRFPVISLSAVLML